MATRYMADREDHREYGQSEGQRNSNEANAHVDVGIPTIQHLSGQDGRSTTAEHEPKRAEELGQAFVT